jgi:hypothetical protein
VNSRKNDDAAMLEWIEVAESACVASGFDRLAGNHERVEAGAKIRDGRGSEAVLEFALDHAGVDERTGRAAREIEAVELLARRMNLEASAKRITER